MLACFFMGGVVGAIKREVAQCGELAASVCRPRISSPMPWILVSPMPHAPKHARIPASADSRCRRMPEDLCRQWAPDQLSRTLPLDLLQLQDISQVNERRNDPRGYGARMLPNSADMAP